MRQGGEPYQIAMHRRVVEMKLLAERIQGFLARELPQDTCSDIAGEKLYRGENDDGNEKER